VTDQVVKFASFDYTPPSGAPMMNIRSSTLETPLNFTPWFTSVTQAKNGNILINQENPFHTQLTPAPGVRTDITPDIINLMMIGTGQHAGYRNFVSNPEFDCQAYPQDT
jgi:hypothetical protein